MSPSDLKMKTKTWQQINTDEDKDILASFMCDKMKEFCSLNNSNNGFLKPSNIAENLVKGCFSATTSGREYIEKNPKATLEDIEKENLPCYMNHCTTFAINAGIMGSLTKILAEKGNLFQLTNQRKYLKKILKCSDYF